MSDSTTMLLLALVVLLLALLVVRQAVRAERCRRGRGHCPPFRNPSNPLHYGRNGMPPPGNRPPPPPSPPSRRPVSSIHLDVDLEWWRGKGHRPAAPMHRETPPGDE